MTLLERIINTHPEAEIWTAEGFHEAILGVSRIECDDNGENEKVVLMYSVTKILEILEKDSKMDFQEAREYFHFNIEPNQFIDFCDDDY